MSRWSRSFGLAARRAYSEAQRSAVAELDYGREKMDKCGRCADRVGEPQPSFELGTLSERSATPVSSE